MCIRDRSSLTTITLLLSTFTFKPLLLHTLPNLSTNPLKLSSCLLYTSDAADERSSVDLGGRRIIKKKKKKKINKFILYYFFFFFQAEDGIRDAQESRGLGDVYKRQYIPCQISPPILSNSLQTRHTEPNHPHTIGRAPSTPLPVSYTHLTLPTSDLV